MYKWPTDILFVRPNGFKVQYAINPHMVNSDGELHKVDEKLAHRQWQDVVDVCSKLGMKVHIVEGNPDFPDMVFCANQFYSFLNHDHKKCALLSKMMKKERQGEVALLGDWLNSNGIETVSLQSNFAFEGMGDLIRDYEGNRLFGGHGFRTEPDIYHELEDLLECDIIPLKLVDETFYHLDTCLSIINSTTAFYVPSAFDKDGKKTLKSSFENLVEIDLVEAKLNFAGNCFSPDGKNILIQKGSINLIDRCPEFNFIELDTSEFIKAGGSVFCMKHILL